MKQIRLNLLKQTQPERTEFYVCLCLTTQATSKICLSPNAEMMSHFCRKIPNIITAEIPEIGIKKAKANSLRWFVFDDRQMYRPKEEVSVKGYIRKISSGKLGDVEPLGDSASGLTYQVYDPRRNEIGKGTANLNAFGAFDFKFKLPDNANLGYARVQISTNSSLGGSSHSHGFQIQEFRRPEFEVSSKVETEAPHFVGEDAKVSGRSKILRGRRTCKCRCKLDCNCQRRQITRRRIVEISHSERGHPGGTAIITAVEAVAEQRNISKA